MLRMGTVKATQKQIIRQIMIWVKSGLQRGDMLLNHGHIVTLSGKLKIFWQKWRLFLKMIL